MLSSFISFHNQLIARSALEKSMNFNHPFFPFFNHRPELNQPIHPIPPWALDGGFPFPPMHYQPPMGMPFQQPPPPPNPNSPLMIHQQNNFYGSNFSSQTLQQRPNSSPFEKIVTQKPTQNVPKQKKKTMLQNPTMRTEPAKQKTSKITEIIQIKDSDELQHLEQIKRSNDLLETNRAKERASIDEKLVKEQKLRNREFLPKRKIDPIFIEARNQVIRQSQVSTTGKLRRSKRNSEQISKKIRKIIHEEMGSGLPLNRKMNKKTIEKKEEVEEELSYSEKTDQFSQCHYLIRADLPHFISVQECPQWKLNKSQDLLSRCFV